VSVPDPYTLLNTQMAHLPALAALQRLVFPSLSAAELLQEQHYAEHLRFFPAGQWVVLYQGRPVATTTTMRHPLTLHDHRFLDISGQLTLCTHQPQADWLYGLDMAVHPEHRSRGLGRRMYEARQALCREYGLKGQITVGMPSGYAAKAGEMDIETYYHGIQSGLIHDPTISVQLKMGFRMERLIHDYLDDPSCGNAGILMTWPLE
jgi:GNAT superfamily N-acetyltransferase